MLEQCNTVTLSLASFLGKRFKDRVVDGKSSMWAGTDTTKSEDEEDGDASQISSELDKTLYINIIK